MQRFLSIMLLVMLAIRQTDHLETMLFCSIRVSAHPEKVNKKSTPSKIEDRVQLRCRLYDNYGFACFVCVCVCQYPATSTLHNHIITNEEMLGAWKEIEEKEFASLVTQ